MARVLLGTLLAMTAIDSGLSMRTRSRRALFQEELRAVTSNTDEVFGRLSKTAHPEDFPQLNLIALSTITHVRMTCNSDSGDIASFSLTPAEHSTLEGYIDASTRDVQEVVHSTQIVTRNWSEEEAAVSITLKSSQRSWELHVYMEGRGAERYASQIALVSGKELFFCGDA